MREGFGESRGFILLERCYHRWNRGHSRLWTGVTPSVTRRLPDWGGLPPWALLQSQSRLGCPRPCHTYLSLPAVFACTPRPTQPSLARSKACSHPQCLQQCTKTCGPLPASTSFKRATFDSACLAISWHMHRQTAQMRVTSAHLGLVPPNPTIPLIHLPSYPQSCRAAPRLILTHFPNHHPSIRITLGQFVVPFKAPGPLDVLLQVPPRGGLRSPSLSKFRTFLRVENLIPY